MPNLAFNTGGAGGAAAPTIRGIGARNNGANFDSGVAIYLDGVYVSRADGAILDNVDIQSVQVVRGPQGTLFGKNATGGAIIYATNKPTEVFEGHAEVNVGNYDRQDGQLTVNVPLVDEMLYSRASIYSTQRNGYVQDVVTATILVMWTAGAGRRSYVISVARACWWISMVCTARWTRPPWGGSVSRRWVCPAQVG